MRLYTGLCLPYRNGKVSGSVKILVAHNRYMQRLVVCFQQLHGIRAALDLPWHRCLESDRAGLAYPSPSAKFGAGFECRCPLGHLPASLYQKYFLRKITAFVFIVSGRKFACSVKGGLTHELDPSDHRRYMVSVAHRLRKKQAKAGLFIPALAYFMMESLSFFAYEFSIFCKMLFRNFIQDHVHAFLRYVGIFYDSIHDIAHQRLFLLVGSAFQQFDVNIWHLHFPLFVLWFRLRSILTRLLADCTSIWRRYRSSGVQPPRRPCPCSTHSSCGHSLLRRVRKSIPAACPLWRSLPISRQKALSSVPNFAGIFAKA